MGRFLTSNLTYVMNMRLFKYIYSNININIYLCQKDREREILQGSLYFSYVLECHKFLTNCTNDMRLHLFSLIF